MPTPKCPFSPADALPVGLPLNPAELPLKKEGSAKVFDRMHQMCAGLIGEVGAERRRGEMVRE